MKKLFLLLFGSLLLLGAGPTWAMNPLAAVTVPSGTTTTFTGAPNRGTGALTTYNNNYYSSIDIQSGGVGIFNDGENVRTLIVRTGGTARFGVGGEVSSAYADFTSSSYVAPSITLEPGGIVQLANPNGIPFATGYYMANNSGGSGPAGASPAYTVTGAAGAYYTFNGGTAQTTAAPADATRGGSTTATASGVALPSPVSRVTLSNSAGLTLANNTGVSQELHLTSGQLTVASGATLTLLSSSTGTALLEYQGGGTLSGSLTVQRYLDGTRNAGAGYRHLGSPVAGATVASFANGSFTPRVNAAYNTNPATVPAASFPTVFTYDEARVGGSVGPVGFDQGWQSPAALTDGLDVAAGYTVNMPAGGTPSFTGPLTGFSGVSVNVGHTAAAGGWALLANPYPAPLNWDGVTPYISGLNTTLYVFKSSGQYAGTYTTYQRAAPAAANTGTNVVPVAQAYFVYNPTQGTTGGIILRNSNTFTSYDATAATPVQRSTTDTRAYLSLKLQDATATQAHQTLVYFDAAATAGLDNQYDSPYLAGAGQALSVTTALAGQEYATNGLPALGTADVLVPLHLRAAAAGTYTLAVAELQNLPAGTHAYLLDASTGQRQDLATTPSLSVTLPAGTPLNSRYSLLFSGSTALATAPAALAQLASLYPNPAHGAATLVLPASLRASQPTPVAILNSLGQVVRRATATTDELTLPLDGLAAGLYTVQAHTAAGTVARRLTVE